MQSNFKAVSISYKNAPIEVREQLSLDDGEVRRLLEKLREVLGITEALILSTCNRTEVFYSSKTDFSETLIKLLAAEKGHIPSDDFTSYFQVFNDSLAAARHLFRVSIGLESQVIGDLQISNQVKRSYQATADTDMAGPFLHRLMHTIFFTSKRVAQETAFRDGAASVSYAAVELVEELTSQIGTPKVLVVGLGEIGADVVRNLQNLEITDITLTNRTFEKAQVLAEECGCRCVPFEQIWDEAKEADVVISSIATSHPFFSKEKVNALHNGSFKCFIDLAVPRSVSPEIEGNIPGMLVYDVDHIHSRTTAALESRKKAIPTVEALVEASLADFDEWTEEMIFSSTIQKFKSALEQIRQEEIARYLKKLDEEEHAKVDKITKSILNKILRMPVVQLKAACKRGEAESLAGVLQDLFNLDAQPEKAKK